MSDTFKGYFFGIVAAVSYGTNPLGVLFLYDAGLRPVSVLFYRFSIAAILLASLMLIQGKSFALTRKEAQTLLGLGALFVVSSFTFYKSFCYMPAGLASTILFFYPVMVAVIMAVFFGEKVRIGTVVSVILALLGIVLLYKGDGDTPISMAGVWFVIVSALTYALYIVFLNRSEIRMSSVKLTFYVLLICIFSNLVASFFDPAGGLQALPDGRSWLSALWLGLVPTVFSLVSMAVAVKYVGSTPTAIMGALEPLTAVVIGVTVFHETFTPRIAAGIVMILSAVIIIVLAKQVSPTKVFSFVNALGHRVIKHWRWR
jgi:drug/metabolite transporter (DMT)-like permease